MSQKRPESRNRRIDDSHPGAPKGKLREIAGCPQCGASYREGRWTWDAAPVGSYEHVCPACERIAQDYPAGVVHLAGGFVNEHRDELVGLLRNHEERERSGHPLKRIMAIEDDEEGIAVKTTDAKLAESLGRALHHAYSGSLALPPTSRDKGNLARVRWSREA